MTYNPACDWHAGVIPFQPIATGSLMNESEAQGSGSTAKTASREHDPLVWVISGYRAGEHTQMAALAEALGWPFRTKALRYRPWDFVPGLLRRSSLAGVDRRASDTLEPPWPDVVITAGMRNEPVARWVRNRAGPGCLLVSVGRPWAGFECFDLVITTPQYRLPDRPNVLQNVGTLHLVNESSLAAARDRWSPRFKDLPSPRIGVLVGGNSGPYTLGPRAAGRLAAQANRMAKETGGSLLVTTSARTSTSATEVLACGLDCPHYLYRWNPDPARNPYLGILAMADALIVTSDTVSMLSEAVGTGKPVHIFDLAGDGKGDFRPGAILYRMLMEYGHPRLTRDLALFHRRLLESGRAVWLGNSSWSSRVNPRSLDDLQRAVQRVSQLFRRSTNRAGASGTSPAQET